MNGSDLRKLSEDFARDALGAQSLDEYRSLLVCAEIAAEEAVIRDIEDEATRQRMCAERGLSYGELRDSFDEWRRERVMNNATEDWSPESLRAHGFSEGTIKRIQQGLPLWTQEQIDRMFNKDWGECAKCGRRIPVGPGTEESCQCSPEFEDGVRVIHTVEYRP